MWSAIAALGGGLLGLGGSIGSHFLQRSSAKQSMADQWIAYKRSLLKGPTLTRQGLEKAGYNPMLALGNLSHPFAGSYTPVGVGDVVSSASTGAKLTSELRRTINGEIRKLEAEADTAEEIARQTKLNTDVVESENSLKKLLADAEIDSLLDGSVLHMNGITSDAQFREGYQSEVKRKRTAREYDTYMKAIERQAIFDLLNGGEKVGDVVSPDILKYFIRPKKAK